MKQRLNPADPSRAARADRPRRIAAGLTLAVSLGLAACNGTPFQVIEDVEFASSLEIDLAQMERLPSGVYIEDEVVGAGAPVTSVSDVRVTYEGFLVNGTKFGEGPLRFVLGTRSVIAGFELGLIGALELGTRKMVVPPALAYGDAQQKTIPAGSVLVFRVTVDEVYDDSTE
jgi:FKBP-type peptidyl-prolyl cis-trans isomerase